MGFVIHWNESAMDLHVFPIPIPPPTSPSTRSLWVFPVHQAWALVSCIQPGLVICFTLDNIHVSMLFSWNIPPSPSPTESKSLFYTSVSVWSQYFWIYWESFWGPTYGLLWTFHLYLKRLCIWQWLMQCFINSGWSSYFLVFDKSVSLHVLSMVREVCSLCGWICFLLHVL